MTANKRSHEQGDMPKTLWGRPLLQRLLVENPRPTSELLGAMVHNIRVTGSKKDFLDEPISIGNLDYDRLSDVRLVQRINLEFKEYQQRYEVTLTSLGELVVARAVIIVDSDGDGTMPIIDANQLLKDIS